MANREQNLHKTEGIFGRAFLNNADFGRPLKWSETRSSKRSSRPQKTGGTDSESTRLYSR